MHLQLLPLAAAHARKTADQVVFVPVGHFVLQIQVPQEVPSAVVLIAEGFVPL